MKTVWMMALVTALGCGTTPTPTQADLTTVPADQSAARDMSVATDLVVVSGSSCTKSSDCVACAATDCSSCEPKRAGDMACVAPTTTCLIDPCLTYGAACVNNVCGLTHGD